MILFFTASSFSQEAPFENFVLGFWPEYDHPGVLVTIQITINQKNLPYDISLVLPPGSKMALQKSSVDENDTQMIPQEILMTDGKSVMPIHLTKSQYYAQFYFNPFDDSGIRKMDYNFSADKNLGHFHVVIQKHILAETFSTNLPDPEILQNDFQLHFYQQHFEHLDTGDHINIQFSYENPTHQTTVEILQTNTDDHPALQQSQTQDESPNTLPEQYRMVKKLILPLLILLIIVLVFIIRINSKQKMVVSGEAGINTKSKSGATPRFCTQCGETLNAGNHFCTKCGRENNVS